MSRAIKLALVLVVCSLFSVTGLPSVHAASQATLVVQASIDDPVNFWNYTFMKDGMPSKVSTIKVEWGSGNTGKDQKIETIISEGKKAGSTSIVTDRNEIINLQVTARNARNEILGTWSMQARNTGQTQILDITLPDSVSPLINAAEVTSSTPVGTER